MKMSRWSKTQLKLAFHLYCQLPFGKLHSRNPEIIELATLIERTPSAVAMKLVNFASLDPAITSTGRRGLGNASALDREIWDEFNADWEGVAAECYELRSVLTAENTTVAPQQVTTELDEFDLQDFTGETKRVVTAQRVKQSFFRRAVLSSYQGRCCMSGLSEPKLLIASHIVPWSKHKEHRLNPRNGLCLSALHDKAFDGGLLTLTDDFRIIISKALSQRKESFVEQVLLPLAGKAITMPQRFTPSPDFVAQHRAEIFLDNR